jgi:hypothetical protein
MTPNGTTVKLLRFWLLKSLAGKQFTASLPLALAVSATGSGDGDVPLTAAAQVGAQLKVVPRVR